MTDLAWLWFRVLFYERMAWHFNLFFVNTMCSKCYISSICQKKNTIVTYLFNILYLCKCLLFVAETHWLTCIAVLKKTPALYWSFVGLSKKRKMVGVSEILRKLFWMLSFSSLSLCVTHYTVMNVVKSNLLGAIWRKIVLISTNRERATKMFL